MSSALPHLALFKDVLFRKAFLFKRSYLEVESLFGERWQRDFDEHLGRLFGDDTPAYEKAVQGYASFSLDAMRLQKLFNQKRRYEDVTYDDATRDVYLNERYMMDVYLPGIFVSQFLWRHHYRQLEAYRQHFLPIVAAHTDKRFYEVGTGSGFFTVQLLRAGLEGFGIDLSPLSRRFTQHHVDRWGLGGQFHSRDNDIFVTDFEPLPCLQCVEVLEHLPDPVRFLSRLRAMLEKGGHAFIAVAITAPQADHIYLYWNAGEVIAHLEEAGFRVQHYSEEPGYAGSEGELVPIVAGFVVS
jgi:2-polyprenyl-3-methyl-5-hydroxy-6-metoxy-1,4-benzoquinol methylase